MKSTDGGLAMLIGFVIGVCIGVGVYLYEKNRRAEAEA
jgi:hypothetical protein